MQTAETGIHVLQSASSAELSDIEHTELISQYGSDQYLRKWSLEDQEKTPSQQTDGGTAKLDVFVPYLMGSTLSSQANHLPAGDCDGTSLLSFNSVQDCPPSSPSARVETANRHPTHQSTESPDFQVWQGYGGNIYFEPMRCNTMTIYNCRPPRIPFRPELKHWKSKSHQPEKKMQQSSMRKLSRDAAVENLGSLRIKTREEQLHIDKEKRSSAKMSGKIYKGFSKNSLAEFTSSSHRHLQCASVAETIQVTGGQVCDPVSDSIHNVQVYNSDLHLSRANVNELMSTSFPTLSASKQSSNKAQGNVTHNVVTGLFVKLPQLNSQGKGKGSKIRSQHADEGRSAAGSQVLKIPFGAFDDPVEVDSTSGQLRRNCVEEKTDTEAKGAELPSPKSQQLPKSKKADGNQPVSCKMVPIETHQICDTNEASVNLEEKQSHVDDASKGNSRLQGSSTVRDEKHAGIFQNPQSANLCLRREISNVSLSNYLKAVPSPQLCQMSDQRLAQKLSGKNRPRLSYTQRTRTRPGGSFNNSVNHITHPFGSKANGYVPCKGKELSKSVDTNKGQERFDRQYQLYVHEVTGEENWSKPCDPSVKKPHGKTSRSHYPLVYTKSEKSTRLGQAILGHQLVRS